MEQKQKDKQSNDMFHVERNRETDADLSLLLTKQSRGAVAVLGFVSYKTRSGREELL